MNHHDQTTQKRRDRSGMSTVEFALLLPFFALLSAGVLMLGHLFCRSVCQSHMAFSAARRCAVGASSAAKWVRADYRSFSMPGQPQVDGQFHAGRPGLCTVTIWDRMPSFLPGRSGSLSVQTRSGATVSLKAAGQSLYGGGDNDL